MDSAATATTTTTTSIEKGDYMGKKRRQPVITVVNDWLSVCSAFTAKGAFVLDVDEQNDAFRALRYSDGLVLTGGGDVHPNRYDGQHHGQNYGYDKGRDRLEFDLVHFARRHRIPMMGICRGHQIINVAHGGTLHPHVPDIAGNRVPHGAGWHNVKLLSDSRLARSLGQLLIGGTTLHHQSVARLGTGLRVIGYAEDGVVEAIETLPGVTPYALGVQFHPEQDRSYIDYSDSIFDHFMEVARRHRDSLNREPDWERIAEFQFTARPIKSYTYGDWGTSGGWEGSCGWEDWETEDDRRFAEWLKANGDKSSKQITEETLAESWAEGACQLAPCDNPYECAQWGDCAKAARKLERDRIEAQKLGNTRKVYKKGEKPDG